MMPQPVPKSTHFAFLLGIENAANSSASVPNVWDGDTMSRRRSSRYSICSAELNTALFKYDCNNNNRRAGQHKDDYSDDHLCGYAAVAGVCVVIDVICSAFV